MAKKTYLCNSCGEQSTDPRTCSNCGEDISAGASGASAAPQAPIATTSPAQAMAAAKPNKAVPDKCPQCHEPVQDKTVLFCESCGYDFVNGKQFVDNTAAPAATTSTAAPVTVSSTPDTVAHGSSGADQAAVQLTAVVETDPSLCTEPLQDGKGAVIPLPDPHTDVDAMPKRYPLNSSVNLIGRGDPANGIVPQIQVTTRDLAVSRAHAEIYLDGHTWRVRHIGHNSPTTLPNGELVPVFDKKAGTWFRDNGQGDLIDAPDVTCGIEVTEHTVLIVGAWTRVRFEKRT